MRGTAVGVVLILATPAVAADPPPAARNAALQYWMAFDQLPRPKQDNDLGLRIAAEWLTIRFTPEVVGHLGRYQRSLVFLHRGAELPACVWPSQLNVGRDGIGVLRNEGSARELGIAACLRARYRFEKGHPKAGLDDLFATLRLARHVGDGGGAINLLIERAVADPAVRCAAAHIWALDDADVMRDALRRWDALPQPTAVADALASEGGQLVETLIARGADFAQPVEPDLLGRVPARPRQEKLGTLAYYAGRETEAESARRFVTAVRREYTRAAEIARLPLAEVKDAEVVWQKGLQANVAKDDRVVWLLVAQMPYHCYRQRLVQERALVARAMLRAAVAARLRGDDTPTERDPFGDGPFTRTPTPTGYELRTRLNDRLDEAERDGVRCGGPVVLSVRTARPAT